jgi:L-alanine-DL-glutamate epimerase-like enolase superfamily enzyme
MQITRIKTFVVGMPGHNVILVKIETDEDLFGIGEASLAGRDQGVLGVLRHFETLLVGRDPSRIEDIWQELYRNTFWRGGPILMSAISGIDPIHVGGITETKKIAIMGEVHDIDLVLHNPTSPVCAAVCVHLDASAPNFGIQEAIHQPSWMREIFPVQPEVERGSFAVSDRPGLGLDFDETAAVKYATDRLAELPHLRRGDGSVTDW